MTTGTCRQSPNTETTTSNGTLSSRVGPVRKDVLQHKLQLHVEFPFKKNSYLLVNIPAHGDCALNNVRYNTNYSADIAVANPNRRLANVKTSLPLQTLPPLPSQAK